MLFKVSVSGEIVTLTRHFEELPQKHSLIRQRVQSDDAKLKQLFHEDVPRRYDWIIERTNNFINAYPLHAQESIGSCIAVYYDFNAETCDDLFVEC